MILEIAAGILLAWFILAAWPYLLALAALMLVGGGALALLYFCPQILVPIVVIPIGCFAMVRWDAFRARRRPRWPPPPGGWPSP